MNRIWLFLCFLCIPWVARGQSAYDWVYWFDDDDSHQHAGTVQGDAFTISAVADGLDEGIHAFHMQVADTAGKYSPPHTTLFYHTVDRTVNTLRYWFDSDVEHTFTTSMPVGTATIDVSHLEPGIHFVYCQAEGMSGILSDVVTRCFYRQLNPQASQWSYWFDGDTEVKHTMTYPGEVVMIDVSELEEGFHTIYNQLTEHAPSDVVPRMFIKIPQTVGSGEITCICTVDEKIVAQHKVPASGGIISWQMDVESLDVGLHRAVFQAITPTGAASTLAERYFVRIISEKEMGKMKCVYSLDNQETIAQAGTMSAGGRFHFDLDVSSMEDGLHRLAYTMVSEDGVTTPQKTAFFWKTPLGGAGIVQYDYWLNDEEQAMRSFRLDSRENPFKLISLLPVDAQPIRSSCFHFEVKNDQPKIYAKNDFHVRFYDTASRCLSETKQYVDYQVGQDVTDVELLEPGIRATADKPEENAIKWYSLTAEPGDSLQFMLDRAATIQLFAPSGEEVHAASGSEAVKWNGLHVRESGTYYLALHDVTATQGTTVSIDYNHIDKYAVLRQDVAVVGNGGCSTITFEGNGFEELKSVDLVFGSIVIPSVKVGHEDNATTSVTFDFTDAQIGHYKATFHFVDENLTKENCITVEEATDNILDVTLNFASTYLINTSNTYTIKIKNQGNMTAFKVPVLVYIFTPNESSLSKIEISGYDVRQSYKNILGEYYTPHVADSIEQMSRTSGDMYYFVHDTNSNYLDGFPHMYCAALNPDLRPNKTETIKIAIKASTTAQLHLWCPDEWYSKENANDSQQTRITRRAKKRGCSSWDMMRANECISRIDYGLVAHPNMNPDCDNLPPDCPHPSGTTTPVNSLDPNDIYGYTAESGSKAIKDKQTDVFYKIEFENDPEFATASAHSIYLTDTLSAVKFDLSTFEPTRIKIGDKTADLSGDKNFVTTLDMRPEINAIAQVEGTYDEKKGIAKWHITSLDPMTMEPTDDPMDGVLPVNVNGNGIGEVSYNISLKSGLAHGTEVRNRAGIVFDTNDVIMTPYWTNVIDRIAPESHVTDVKMLNDSTASVSITASDELSGPWRYDVYVQYGTVSGWMKMAENVPVDTTASVKVYEGINHGFYVVVTDSAGNVEQKDAVREFVLEVFGSQVDTNTQLDLAEGWNWISHNQNEAMALDGVKTKATRIVGQTEEAVKDVHFGWMGDLEEMLPTQMYKLQMAEADNVQLSGKLFNAGFRSIPLYQGWNWIGYPVANTMSPTEALAKLEAEEGDFIIGQDGMATYSEGQWAGTLLELCPGQGYMYRSVSDKNLFYNATAQASSRSARVSGSRLQVSYPEGWAVDKHKYPNVMAMIATLSQNGSAVDADEWLVAAFCGDECRGIAQNVGGMMMMNIYGTGAETISFYAMNRETEEVLPATETEAFRTDVLGSMQQPYELHIGEVTGIKDMSESTWSTGHTVYDLQGRRLDSSKVKGQSSQLNKGVYIVTDGKNTKTQKVVRR